MKDLNQIVNIYNQYFVQATDKLLINPNVNQNVITPYTDHSFVLYPVNEKEIEDILISLSKKHSEDSDGVPCYLIKDIADILTIPLTYSINHWKMGNTQID